MTARLEDPAVSKHVQSLKEWSSAESDMTDLFTNIVEEAYCDESSFHMPVNPACYTQYV